MRARLPPRDESERMHSCPIVMYVSHTGSWGGGAEVVLQSMIREARMAGYSPHLVCPPGHLPARVEGMCDSITVISLPWLRRTLHPLSLLALVWTWLAVVVRLARNVHATKPHLIHANSGVAALIACGPAAATRVPLIWHQHDIVPVRRVNRLVLGLCGHLCHTIAVTSRAVGASLVRLGISERKIQVIHPCVEENFLSPPPDRDCSRAALELPSQAIVLSVIARLVPRKGQSIFLETLRDVARSHPQVQGLIVGRTPDGADFGPEYEAELRQMAEAPDLSGRIRFAGFQDDVRAVLAASDMLVVPSYNEPFGIVIIEAFALGVPVVAAAAGGPCDIIDDGVTGLLVPPGDVAALSAAIGRLLSDSTLRDSIVAEAQRSVRAQFSPQSFRTRLASLYGVVAGSHAKPASTSPSTRSW